MIVLGGIIFVIGMMAKGWDFSTLSNLTYQKQDVVYADQEKISSTNRLQFDFAVVDLEVTFYDGENIEIEYYQTVRKKNGKAVTELQTVYDGGTLKFEEKRNIFGSITIGNFTIPTTKIKIPNAMSCDLEIDTDVGFISFGKATEEIFIDGKLSLSSDTGVIEILSNVTVNGNVEISQDTGELKVSGKVNCQGEFSSETDTGRTVIDGDLTAERIKIESDTGSVNVNGNATATTGVTVKVDTGRINVNGKVTAGVDVYFTSSTGRQEIKGEIVASSVWLVSGTGDINCTAVITASQISARASTGDITLKLKGKKGDYSISVETDTGDKNVENSTGGQIGLTVQTSTGDITVNFVE